LGSYRIPRYLLARLAAEEYVRQFWWFVLIIPTFGIVAAVFGSGLLQVIGYFAILWPATIPARSILGAWRTGTFFSDGVDLALSEGNLLFTGKLGKGMKLKLSSVRSVQKRYGFLMLRFGIGEFVAVPLDPLGPQANLLEQALLNSRADVAG
jgi:hypothetical protein